MSRASSESTSDRPAAPAGRLDLILRVAWTRLRFVAAVVALFVLVLLWRHLGASWNQAAAWLAGSSQPQAGVSPDTQYFCPMCPGVLSAWPEKCPVCKMPLVRRAIGSAPLLPEGVLARMQISPYRLQLGGIQTSTVGYLPLEQEVHAPGQLSRDDQGWLVTASVNPWDAPLIASGLAAEALVAAAPADIRLPGQVESITGPQDDGQAAELRMRIEPTTRSLAAGTPVDVTIRIPLATIEPFRSQPRDAPPLSAGAPRQYFVCPNHPSWIRAQAGKCPFDGLDLERRDLREDQRLEWSCVLHFAEHHAQRGDDCPHCNRGCHVPVVVDYAPAGEVLAVPRSAVIDNGRQKVVYVQTMPGMFDGVEIQVGAVQGEYYPILAGLSAGDRVAASGAFLLDAETRLNPALAASYFGAGSLAPVPGTQRTSPSAAADHPPQADRLAGLKLSPDDLVLARRQAICPITRLALGSMGELVRVEIDGRPVFLCCAACRGKVRTREPSSAPAAPQGPRP